MTMASKANDPAAKSGLSLFVGQDRNDAMAHMQRELLEAYEQASRAWLARAKSEADLWSELTREADDDPLHSNTPRSP
jgi:hypothetical protein